MPGRHRKTTISSLRCPRQALIYLVGFPTGTHAAYSDTFDEAQGECGGEHVDQAVAHDDIDLYATAFFGEYLLGDQSWNWALDPKHAADDPNVEFEASLP